MVSVRAICSTKAVWAVAKEADVAAKVWIEVIMDIKSPGEMRIVSIGVAEVLGPTESTGAGGTGGSDDGSSGLVEVGIVDVGMWGSSVRVVGSG